MFLLNLTWLQFFAVFGGVSAGVVALYLWDRSRRRVVVPTLRFWTAAEKGSEVKHRRRIQQPWSLLLQLLSIALLLLALAQLRFGSAGPVPRDHVLILDTSAWMGARNAKGLLMDQASAAARAYVAAMPAGDRVMLVRADALATPATAFERNRAVLEDAIARSRPGATALNLAQAFEFAKQAQKLQGGRAGEIVYIGGSRITDNPEDLARVKVPALRVVQLPPPAQNCGLKKIGLRRSASDPDVWEILVGVHNYGQQPRTASVALAFGGSPAGRATISVAPGADQNATFNYRARSGGWLEARVLPADDFTANQRAVLEVPPRRALRVAVYSEEPELLKPVLSANSEVDAVFRRPSEYQPRSGADIVILDRFTPPAPPQGDAIWIQPHEGGAPVGVRSTVENVPLVRWRSDHPLAAGLRVKDIHLETAEVLDPLPGDVSIAEVEAGPVIVARSARTKTVVLGFHPVRSAMRYELATPLLFANILRWMAPDMFRRWELAAGSVGTVNVPLGSDAEAASVRVVSENGAPLPYTVQARSVRFFAANPGTVRITTGDRELVYSLSLPEVPETTWTAPASARRGLPRFAPLRLDYAELWPWLAAAGALALLLEFLLYGRWRASIPAPPRTGRWRAAFSAVRSVR